MPIRAIWTTLLSIFSVNSIPVGFDNKTFLLYFTCLGNCIGSTEDVVKLLGVTAEMFIRKKEWFQKYPSNNNSVLFPCIFGTFSRFLSDLPTVYDRCRQHLIHVVDFILREHFQQLLPMGRELVLALQRVSKIFPAYWKNLTYQPQSLLPNFEGNFSTGKKSILQDLNFSRHSTTTFYKMFASIQRK